MNSIGDVNARIVCPGNSISQPYKTVQANRRVGIAYLDTDVDGGPCPPYPLDTPSISLGVTYPDMVNFGPRDTVPEKFADRLFYQHNPTVTLMQTAAEENARIGQEIGRKVAASTGPAAVMLPLTGVSAIDADGPAFDDLAARCALFDAIRQNHERTELIELKLHINDAEFAEAAARRLLQLVRSVP